MVDSTRGRIPVPDLDDRSWKDIVDQAVSLIPKYAPQWTDHGPSDMGITLIELFAWLVEGLIFRLNQVPDKNYIAFLNLLGISRNPPEPARTFLTFSIKGDKQELRKGLQAQTAATETGAPIVFETDTEAEILPINLDVALRIDPLSDGKTQYSDVSASFTASPAKGETIRIAAQSTVRLLLGFDGRTAETIRLGFRLSSPFPTPQTDAERAADAQVVVIWSFSQGTAEPDQWLPLGGGVADGTRGLKDDGLVEIKAPAEWSSQKRLDKDRFWLALNIANGNTTPASVGIERILFNAVSAHSALTIAAPELLGVSNGKPFQTFALANGPLFRVPATDKPYSHLRLSVETDGRAEDWVEADDFPEGPGKLYRIDPVTAEISFGNHDPQRRTGHGSVPPEGAKITAVTYRYVASGAAGNLGSGSIIALRSKEAGIDRVTNLAAAYGGADEESIEDAKRRAPELLRNRNRAVTKEDYEYLAMQASTELATVRCLGPVYNETSSGVHEPKNFGGIDRSAGNVNVILLPLRGPDKARPSLTPELAQEVTAYLDRRRDVATRLQVHGPRYLPIDVTVTAFAWKQAKKDQLIQSSEDVKNYITGRLEKFLHPVTGGTGGEGWEIGQSVSIAELYQAAAPPDNWGFMSSLKITAGAFEHQRPPLPQTTGEGRVQLADFELACIGKIKFDPETLGEV